MQVDFVVSHKAFFAGVPCISTILYLSGLVVQRQLVSPIISAEAGAVAQRTMWWLKMNIYSVIVRYLISVSGRNSK